MITENVTQYEYVVTLVTDFSTITTGTALWLDDNQGNMSSEAREQAIKNAVGAIKDELGITGDLNYWDTQVKLLLNDDEVLI